MPRKATANGVSRARSGWCRTPRDARPVDVADPVLGRRSGRLGAGCGCWRTRRRWPPTTTRRPSSRFDADLGYGIALFGDSFTGTPNVGFGMSDAVRGVTGLGWAHEHGRRIRRGLRGQSRSHPARERRRGRAWDRAARQHALVGGVTGPASRPGPGPPGAVTRGGSMIRRPHSATVSDGDVRPRGQGGPARKTPWRRASDVAHPGSHSGGRAGSGRPSGPPS